jgi:hypothetical protein
MMFTKRNERDLSEVKELAYELGKGAQGAAWAHQRAPAAAAGEKILTRPDPALPK